VARIQLTSDSIGSLFTIPEGNWTAIDRRVDLVLLAKDAAALIAQTIPPFPALVAQCEVWRAATLPGVLAQSQSLAAWASAAMADFAELQRRMAGLNEMDPLPPETHRFAECAMQGLATSTRVQKDHFDPLLAGVREFASRNMAVDAIVDRNVRKLGPEWKSLAAESAGLQQASGKVLGGWQALSHDLDQVAAGKFTLDVPFLLDLEIAVAVRSWENIAREAAAFPAKAAGRVAQEVRA